MASETCAEAWLSDSSKRRAEAFDEKFPNCCCEEHSFAGRERGVHDDELVARLFTTPYSYLSDTQGIIWNKLVRVYSDGLSTFRAGCDEAEIREAIERLTTGGAEPNTLAGATLLRASEIRKIGDPQRTFCVYDTAASEFSVHADLIGTWSDKSLSNSKQREQRESRTRELRRIFNEFFVPSATADELIAALRARGFTIN